MLKTEEVAEIFRMINDNKHVVEVGVGIIKPYFDDFSDYLVDNRAKAVKR